MRVQEQKWHDFTRLLITVDGGSVQVELFDTEQEFGCKAFLYGLWVDEPCRRAGFATWLMDVAERETSKRGYNAIALEWKLQDTPIEIFKWYERRGYDKKAFDGRATWALMVKEL